MKECPRCGAVAEEDAVACGGDGTTLETTLRGSSTIDGRYSLEKRLGAGGMGVVYAARHRTLRKRFAIKFLPPGSTPAVESLARFRVEARALGAVDHPGIVRVTDFGVDPRDGGLPYLVMELLEGVSLAERCAGRLPIPPESALELLSQLAAALDHAHARGILHRDLKPTNILLVRAEDGAERPRILDFGIARLADSVSERGRLHNTDRAGSGDAADVGAGVEASPLTSAGALLGTVGYLAPELLAGGEATRASDLYAFGAVAWQLLAGERPFEGAPWELVRAHRELAPALPSSRRRDLPRELDAPLMSALAKEPGLRPASAGEFVTALRDALDDARRAAWRHRERPRRLALAVGLALLAVVGSRWLWALPPVEWTRLFVYDRQLQAFPARPPDPSFVTVVFEEETLAASSRPLGDDADGFARRLDELFAAGARGVAVDLLLPRHWADSRPFAEALLRHEERLTLGAFSTGEGRIVGPEALSPLVVGALGAERAAALFGYLNLEGEVDGVVRRGRLEFTDRDGRRRPSFALAALRRSGLAPTTSRDGWFWIDRTVASESIPRIAWQEVSRRAEEGVFRDRLVWIGGDFADAGEDAHPVFRGAAPLPGLLVHLLAATTVRAGTPLRDLDASVRAGAAAIAVALVAALALLERRLVAAVVVALALGVTLFFLSSMLLSRYGLVADAVGPLVTLAAGCIAAVALRRASSPFLHPARAGRRPLGGSAEAGR